MENDTSFRRFARSTMLMTSSSGESMRVLWSFVARSQTVKVYDRMDKEFCFCSWKTIFCLQDKFLSRREAIMGEVAKNNEVAEEEEVSHSVTSWLMIKTL